MFEMAERDLPEGIDKVHSYMIGDKRIDAQAGKNFGVTGVLVGTGYGAKEHAEDRAAGLIKRTEAVRRAVMMRMRRRCWMRCAGF